jgi:hypothetical protein
MSHGLRLSLGEAARIASVYTRTLSSWDGCARRVVKMRASPTGAAADAPWPRSTSQR